MGIVAPTGFTGDFLDFYLNNTQLTRVTFQGAYLATSFGGLVSSLDGTLTPGNGSTATKLNRNQADAIAVLNLLQQNAGSTGDILDLSNSAGIVERFTQQGYLVGVATAPSGTCSVAGAWVFSQDGHATFCPSAGGTWTTKI